MPEKSGIWNNILLPFVYIVDKFEMKCQWIPIQSRQKLYMKKILNASFDLWENYSLHLYVMSISIFVLFNYFLIGRNSNKIK